MSGPVGAHFRIGEAASRAGVTTRTLRYYQEVGLLQPSSATPGGNRLYTAADVERLRRILELRDVMGFDLERIRLFLGSEDRLAELRAEAQRGTSTARRAEMVAEAFQLNRLMQAEVAEKQGVLTGVLAELRAKAVRYRETAAEIGLDLDADPESHGERPRLR
jgi:MerR family transcriptional regulator, repressor of the yfmOP operon